ncbi:MAG: GAF domain-containing sensor histidine kinase, partial [Thermomicrobiales bacterium]
MNRALSLNQLKWVTVLAPLVFLALLGALARFAGAAFFGTWTGIVLFGVTSLVAVFLFSAIIFRFIGNLQHQLEMQNQELLALHQASLAISRHLDL